MMPRPSRIPVSFYHLSSLPAARDMIGRQRILVSGGGIAQFHVLCSSRIRKSAVGDGEKKKKEKVEEEVKNSR